MTTATVVSCVSGPAAITLCSEGERPGDDPLTWREEEEKAAMRRALAACVLPVLFSLGSADPADALGNLRCGSEEVADTLISATDL